jgi:hypothetical protein
MVRHRNRLCASNGSIWQRRWLQPLSASIHALGDEAKVDAELAQKGKRSLVMLRTGYDIDLKCERMNMGQSGSRRKDRPQVANYESRNSQLTGKQC